MSKPAGLIRTNGRVDARWWLSDDTDSTLDERSAVHDRLIPVVRFLRHRQAPRRRWDLLYASLYGNLRMQGFGSTTYTQVAGLEFGMEDDRLTLNLGKNMVQAVTSRITKNRPRATITTQGEDYSRQRRAKLLELFVDGQFYKTQFRDKAVDAFRNACIYGTGILKVWAEGEEIHVENIPSWLITVDETECLVPGIGPRNIYEHRYIDREVLIDTFAKGDEELERKIRDAKLHTDDEGGYGYDQTADQLLVHEAWHLGPNGKPGRHAMVLDNVTLLDEPYKRDTLPFLIIRWSKPPAGFHGLGLISELMGIQTEVNKLLRQIQQAHHLCGWPRIFVQRGSKVQKSHLNNIIGAVVEYDGQMPHQAAFPTVPGEIYQHLQFLIKSAYEIAGVSQLTATSQKPAGIESGVALMTLQDVQSDRFTEVGRAWEELHADGARHIVELSAAIAKKNPDFAIKALGKNVLREIKWDEAALEIDQYVLQIFPTSMLPHTPAGRLQFADLLQKMGLLEQWEAFDLLDFPDTYAMQQRKRAGRDVIDRDLENIRETGEYVSPEPFDDLQYALTRAQQEYDRARLDKVPEAHRKALQRYMQAAANLLAPPPPPADPNAAMPGAPGAPPPPGGGPPGTDPTAGGPPNPAGPPLPPGGGPAAPPDLPPGAGGAPEPPPGPAM